MSRCESCTTRLGNVVEYRTARSGRKADILKDTARKTWRKGRTCMVQCWLKNCWDRCSRGALPCTRPDSWGGCHLVGRDAQGPDVSCLRIAVSSRVGSDDFRGHPKGGAHKSLALEGHSLAELAGHTKIRDLDLPVSREQHVGGLNVSMDAVAIVQVHQSLQHLSKDEGNAALIQE